MRSNYAIAVGKWYGVWSFVWYADIMTDNEANFRYASFNGLTKRSVMRKAKRFINKLNNDNELIYLYDGETGDIRCLENSERR